MEVKEQSGIKIKNMVVVCSIALPVCECTRSLNNQPVLHPDTAECVWHFSVSFLLFFIWQRDDREYLSAADEDVPALQSHWCRRWDWDRGPPHALGHPPCLRHRGGRCYCLRVQQHPPHHTADLHHRQPGVWCFFPWLFMCSWISLHAKMRF